MPKKLTEVSRSTLIDAPLPQATKSYTVISHQLAIGTIMQALEENNFTVSNEVYRCTDDAQIAQGNFIIKYGDDPELNMMYGFVNSYNKALRFRSAVGAAVNQNDAYILSRVNTFRRKHTGAADNEMIQHIKDHISTAGKVFEEIRALKDVMKEVEVSKEEFANLLGKLFMEDLLGTDQLSVIKKEYSNPSFDYTTDEFSLWTLYNHVIYALKQTHPTKWLQNQAAVHMHFMTDFDLIQFDVDNSTLKNQSEETETEQSEDNDETPVENIESEDNSNIEHATEATVMDAQTGNIETPDGEIILPGFGGGSFKIPVHKDDFGVKVEMSPEQQEKVEEFKENFEATSVENSEEEIAEILTQEEEPEKTVAEMDQEEDDDWDKHGMVPVEAAHSSTDPQETVAEDNGYPADWDSNNEDAVYVPKSAMEGVEIGDIIEIDDVMYKVQNDEMMDGEMHFVLIETSEASVEENQTEEVVEEVQEKPQVEEEESFEDDFEAEESVEEEPVAEEAPIAEESESEYKEASTPMEEAIASEIYEVYGENHKFKYEEVDGEFNVELETGETIVFAASYIENLVA